MAAFAEPPGNLALQYGRYAALLIACVPLAYYALATLAAVRFFSDKRRKSLSSFTPPVSILKPVRGVDFASYENFRSFCIQDYPEYEILFCVNDPNDAAVPLIRRLEAEFPKRVIRLLSSAPWLGSNGKVNSLALLAREAKYDLLMQSDGDVRVGPNYLRELAAQFEKAETGAVSCLYRGVVEKNRWAEMEALGAATDFFAGVLVAEWMEGVTFALGASVATTKPWLSKIGGYEALANFLADDYEIGNRVAKAGGRVKISREIVETMYPALTFAKFWEHQVRWARTIRLCRPVSYLGLIFTQGLPLAIIGAVASRTVGGAVFFLCAYVVLRCALACILGIWGMRDRTTLRKWWLLPLRDLFQFAVYVGSFFSNRIVWGDQEFELCARGEMVLVTTGDEKAPEKPMRAG